MRARLWRLLYALFESRLSIWATRVLLALLRRVLGPARTDGLVALLDRRIVRSGWPYHSSGWVNLHAARFLAQVQHTALPIAGRAQHAAAGLRRHTSPARVGVLGAFSGMLAFPPRLFAAFPAAHELALFDVEYDGVRAPYLGTFASTYVPVYDDPSSASLAMTADAIHAAQLDLLINTLWKGSVYKLLDYVNVSCIAHYSCGSEPLYHANVDIQFYPQPEADYFVRNDRLFCATTQRSFSDRMFASIDPYYDIRDLQTVSWPSWREREPLVTFHGSLYKLAQEPYLSELFSMLADESAVEFAFMGKDNGVALERIKRQASRHGIAGRVHYEGVFTSLRGSDGEVDDPGWAKMSHLLSRARLAANPYPLGGGSARVEAYAAGTPCIGIRLSFDSEWWNRPQAVVCDVPAIHVPAGSAWSVREYFELSRRCLSDEAFFARVVAEQREALLRLADPARWWRDVLNVHERWVAAKTKFVDPAD